MDELTINQDYMATLMLRVRSLMAADEGETPETQDGFDDDEAPTLLEDGEEDLSREELVREIEGLDDDKQAELVALMWLGRGDGEAEAWAELTRLAAERRELPTAGYLLDHPLLADYWALGLDRLGYGSVGDV